MEADYTDGGGEILRNGAFLKKQFKEIFGPFLAQSGVSLGSIHPARFLELRLYEITVAQRETQPDSGARIRICSWSCQWSAMELLTPNFVILATNRRCIEMDVTVRSSQYCILGQSTVRTFCV